MGRRGGVLIDDHERRPLSEDLAARGDTGDGVCRVACDLGGHIGPIAIAVVAAPSTVQTLAGFRPGEGLAGERDVLECGTLSVIEVSPVEIGRLDRGSGRDSGDGDVAPHLVTESDAGRHVITMEYEARE